MMFPLMIAAIGVFEITIRWFDIHAIEYAHIWIILIPLIFSIIISYLSARFTAKEVAHPIKLFIESAKAIARGNFDHKVNVHTSEEMTQLSRIFNYMTRELKEINQGNIRKTIQEKIKTEAIIRNIADGIIVVGPLNEVLMINEVVEGWFHVQQKAVIGFSLNFFFPELKFLVKQALDTQGETVFQDELTIKPLNSPSEIYLGANASKVMDNDDLIALVIVLRNITKEKEIDRMKTELVNVVAHELRSPLTSIAGFSEIIKDPHLSEAIRKEYIDIIHYESGRLAEMISKFLDISRIESGKTVINKVPCDLTTVVDNTITANTPMAQKRSMHVSSTLPKWVPLVHADPDLIGQVVLNFFSNAVKYSPEGSEIKMRVAVADDTVIVEVSDNGYGISKENMKNLFQKFFRAKDEKHVKDVEGTGLGLAFVKEIIHQHNGTIHVESEVGKGSSFSFALPIDFTLPENAALKPAS